MGDWSITDITVDFALPEGAGFYFWSAVVSFSKQRQFLYVYELMYMVTVLYLQLKFTILFK